MKILALLILAALMFTGCEKSETGPGLKGTIKGRVSTFNEFGNQTFDNNNISIQLEGSDPLISAASDDSGKFEINEIPTGTYDLVLSKEGYGNYIMQGFQVVGGNEPFYLFHLYLVEKSSTVIEDLSMEVVNDSEIYVKGIVTYRQNELLSSSPAIIFFIHNANNPSEINYSQVQQLTFSGESGTQLFWGLYLDRALFPSGSKIFVIAYGRAMFDTMYYDILSNKYYYTNLGTGSNIATITIP
jgi:hypothetical protein